MQATRGTTEVQPSTTTRPITLGVIVGNRDFFPDSLIAGARAQIKALVAEMGIEVVMVDEQTTKLGAVETYADAAKCAALFRAHADRIDGVLVALPNFGDEKAVADTLRGSGLQVPILIQAEPDELARLDLAHRRDSFCGKISVCNNLRQYGYPFSLTERHAVALGDREFRQELEWFAAVCRVVRGLCRARLGAIGARPAAFNTVRFSEKILERAGIAVVTKDLSSILGDVQRLAADDPRVAAKTAAITGYADASKLPKDRLELTARLAVVIESWCDENDVDATAIQCWNSIQANYGVNACTVMSMLSEKLLPSACEVDVTGLLAMYARVRHRPRQRGAVERPAGAPLIHHRPQNQRRAHLRLRQEALGPVPAVEQCALVVLVAVVVVPVHQRTR